MNKKLNDLCYLLLAATKQRYALVNSNQVEYYYVTIDLWNETIKDKYNIFWSQNFSLTSNPTQFSNFYSSYSFHSFALTKDINDELSLGWYQALQHTKYLASWSAN